MIQVHITCTEEDEREYLNDWAQCLQAAIEKQGNTVFIEPDVEQKTAAIRQHNADRPTPDALISYSEESPY